MLKDVATDVQKTIKTEVKDIHHSIQVRSNLMQYAINRVNEMKSTVLEMKKKNVKLANKNKHLETRVEAFEQRTQHFEQQKLARYLDIHYIHLKMKISSKLPMLYRKS